MVLKEIGLLTTRTFQGFHWTQSNPTRISLDDVGIRYHGAHGSRDNGIARMAHYEERDPRATFMSIFPVSILFQYLGSNLERGILKSPGCALPSSKYVYTLAVADTGQTSVGHRLRTVWPFGGPGILRIGLA